MKIKVGDILISKNHESPMKVRIDEIDTDFQYGTFVEFTILVSTNVFKEGEGYGTSLSYFDNYELSKETIWNNEIKDIINEV